MTKLIIKASEDAKADSGSSESGMAEVTSSKSRNRVKRQKETALLKEIKKGLREVKAIHEGKLKSLSLSDLFVDKEEINIS